jgi:hypothetical protein
VRRSVGFVTNHFPQKSILSSKTNSVSQYTTPVWLNWQPKREQKPVRHVDCPNFPDPAEHVYAILEALEGDYQIALEHMDIFRKEFGDSYARRLTVLLTPAGKC